MVFQRIAAACFVIAILPSAGLIAQTGAGFTDGFEGATLNPFWTPFTSSGTVTVPSSVLVHSGNQSLKLNTFNTTGVNKAAGVLHNFSPPAYGRVEVWLYDSGANVPSSNYFSLYTGPFGIGTNDYDLGPGNNGSFYDYTVFGGPGTPTTIDRALGWHHFVIRTSATATILEIDGTTIFSGPGGTPLTGVQLEMHAPSWRPPFTTYFDDFVFDPCDGQPCSQSNSACATLIVNGAGASGQGPFAVAAPAGTFVSFFWTGSPNQPIILAQAPTFVQGQNLGGGLIVDLDLAAFTVLFSGVQTPGFFYATTAAGWTSQVYTVPSSLAGAVARVQGVVLDANHLCSGSLGLMTTASFEIQF